MELRNYLKIRKSQMMEKDVKKTKFHLQLQLKG